MKEASYIFVYLSYEDLSNNYVEFDDFKITHTKSNLIQANEYYSFGLPTENRVALPFPQKIAPKRTTTNDQINNDFSLFLAAESRKPSRSKEQNRNSMIVRPLVLVLLFISSFACAQQENTDVAIKRLDDQLKASPASPLASQWHWQRGVLYFQSLQYEKALDDFKSCIAVTIATHEERIYFKGALYYQGLCKEKLNDLDGAVHDYDETLSQIRNDGLVAGRISRLEIFNQKIVARKKQKYWVALMEELEKEKSPEFSSLSDSIGTNKLVAGLRKYNIYKLLKIHDTPKITASEKDSKKGDIHLAIEDISGEIRETRIRRWEATLIRGYLKATASLLQESHQEFATLAKECPDIKLRGAASFYDSFVMEQLGDIAGAKASIEQSEKIFITEKSLIPLSMVILQKNFIGIQPIIIEQTVKPIDVSKNVNQPLTENQLKEFEPGYLIDNAGSRIECKIKNEIWIRDPAQFEYVLPGVNSPTMASISLVKEFGIYNKRKFVRATVDIDVSGYRLATLSIARNPEWSREQIFLEVLIEGKASLYYCERDYGKRFFFAVDSLPITQLVYKKYFANGKENVAVNRYFKSQLKEKLSCEMIASKIYGSLNYEVQGLKNYFLKYNECNGRGVVAQVDYSAKNKEPSFHLTIRPGFNFSSLQITNTGFPGEPSKIDFPSKMNFRLGLEVEIILSARRTTWALIVEPTYRVYTAESPSSQGANINYQSVELPFGVRGHFPMKNKTNLFLNGGVVIDHPFRSNVHTLSMYTNNTTGNLDVTPTYTAFLGGGIVYRKFSMELRYFTNRDFLTLYHDWASHFKTISFILGIRML